MSGIVCLIMILTEQLSLAEVINCQHENHDQYSYKVCLWLRKKTGIRIRSYRTEMNVFFFLRDRPSHCTGLLRHCQEVIP